MGGVATASTPAVEGILSHGHISASDLFRVRSYSDPGPSCEHPHDVIVQSWCNIHPQELWNYSRCVIQIVTENKVGIALADTE